MPVRPLGSHKPRRAIDDTDAFLECATGPRRAPRTGRLVRASIAVGTAGIVGLLALTAPGIALSASASNAAPMVTTEARVGTTDAFSARGTSTDRDTTREALSASEIATAAEQRAAALSEVGEQLSEKQTEAAALARSQSLATTVTSIDHESQRIVEENTLFWPTEGGISSGWGPRLHPILKYTRLHGGVDIGGAVGAPIYAVSDGVVTKAARGYNGGSGNNVRLAHGQFQGRELESSYLHMNDLVVEVGQTVERGQLIGYVGNTGLSTAPHLHFSIYLDGANSDPAPYLVPNA